MGYDLPIFVEAAKSAWNAVVPPFPVSGISTKPIAGSGSYQRRILCQQTVRLLSSMFSPMDGGIFVIRSRKQRSSAVLHLIL